MPLEPSNPALPWHLPPANLVYQSPPPPAPPPAPLPPPVRFTFSAYTQVHTFMSNVEGSMTELGGRFGFGNGSTTFGVGFLPGDGALALSVDTLRHFGMPLTSGSVELFVLAPTIQGKIIADFSDNFFMNAGVSATGLRVSSCRTLPIPWFVDLRVPYFSVWLPLVTGGASFDEAAASPALSWGLGIEAGVLTF
jgi:hypothetical protein